jgi:prepilin-type processing-associated H-X9-DG protein
MALVTVLYALAYGPGSAALQTRKREQCVEQLKQMHSVLQLYASDHEGAFPEADGPTSESALSRLVPSCTTDTSVFICPGSGLAALPAAKPFADRRISYAYCAGLKRDSDPGALLVADRLANPRLVLKGDALFSLSGTGAGSNHRKLGGNLLFVDGHVETAPAIAERPVSIPAGATLLNPKP